MKYGAAIFPTEYAIDPATLGRALEDRGFESFWVAEHTHIPCSRKSPWPGGADLPRMYFDLYSPFLALVAAATATRNLKVATGVCLVPQHDPIVLAKDVATIDRLSKGRFLFGVGGGWNQEEMQNHGSVPFRQRWGLMRERIEAMKVVWTQERAEYHGQWVDFEPLFSWPKPEQRPHPPIHVAGSAPHALARAVRYGDGWLPILGRGNADLAADLRQLARLAAEAGRSVDGFEVSIYACPTDPEKLRWLRDLRVTRAVFLLPAEPAESVLPLLDRYAELARSVG